MKLKKVKIKGFRGFNKEISVELNDLTVFIGKNDAGKSSIMEALAIFFDEGTVKIEKDDLNVHSEDGLIEITCDFNELPDTLILDSGLSTNLQEEYLTLEHDLLRIKKVFDCNKSKISSLVYIQANHPSAKDLDNLLSLKEKDLQDLVKSRGLDCPLKGNPLMRKALWNSVKPEELDLQVRNIDVSKLGEKKEIWSKLVNYLPRFALFQTDRNSQDSDDEVQNPMKAAVQEAIAEVQDEIDSIQSKVKDKAEEIAKQTLKALGEISPQIANKLSPEFTSPTPAKWNSLFNISLETDEGIPLNKRGSGTRRMILVSFFRATAERTKNSESAQNIVYAIEEPETSQHPDNQKLLLESLKKISESEGYQVILTTHSPGLAKEISTEDLRFVHSKEEDVVVSQGENVFSEIAETLGVLPEIRTSANLIVCVEGPTDEVALRAFSRCLKEKYPDTVDLSHDNKDVVVLPIGGSNLKYFVERNYLKNLNIPQIYIVDNDVTAYTKYVNSLNNKENCRAFRTKKYEIENYLHKKAIEDCYNVKVDTEQKKLPERFAKECFDTHSHAPTEKQMGSNAAKKKLSLVFEKGMNYDLLQEVDPEGEIKGWFDEMAKMLRQGRTL